MEDKTTPVESAVPQEAPVLPPIPVDVVTQSQSPVQAVEEKVAQVPKPEVVQENSAQVQSLLPVASQGTSKMKIAMWAIVGVISVPIIFFGAAFIYGAAQGLIDLPTTKSTQNPFISEEKDFQATFPGVPTKKIESLPIEGKGDLPMVTYASNIDRSYYAVITADYSKIGLSFEGADSKKVLDGSAHGASEEAKTTIDSMTYGSSNGNAYVDVFHSNAEAVIHQRIIIIGNSLYQIIVSQEKKKVDDSYKAFFDSFKYIGTTTQTMTPSTTNGEYSIKEISSIIEGNDKEAGKKVVAYIAQNPNAVDQFALFNIALYTFSTLGNKEQGAFLYYVAQVRTRAYVKADPDESASPALRASLMEAAGPIINKWVGSDVVAWGKLAEKAIAYEKKLPYSVKPGYVKSQAEWEALVDKERATYEADFNTTFTEKVLNDKSAFEAGRKKNGLYVGPWKDSGEPLPKEWQ